MGIFSGVRTSWGNRICVPFHLGGESISTGVKWNVKWNRKFFIDPFGVVFCCLLGGGGNQEDVLEGVKGNRNCFSSPAVPVGFQAVQSVWKKTSTLDAICMRRTRTAPF